MKSRGPGRPDHAVPDLAAAADIITALVEQETG
jgi:hypothetical protein